MPLPAPPVASPEPSSHSLSSPVAATSPPTVGNTVYLIPSPPTSAPPPAHPIRTRSKSGIFKPKVPFHLSNVSHSLSPIPRVYSEALRDPYWCQDMLTKYTAFIKNKTWDLVPCPLPSPSPPPPSTNVVSSMRIFRHKFHSNSSLDRYKERWLARGVNQQPGHDYDETFSPVVKPTMFRRFLLLPSPVVGHFCIVLCLNPFCVSSLLDFTTLLAQTIYVGGKKLSMV